MLDVSAFSLSSVLFIKPRNSEQSSSLPTIFYTNRCLNDVLCLMSKRLFIVGCVGFRYSLGLLLLSVVSFVVYNPVLGCALFCLIYLAVSSLTVDNLLKTTT